jgi:hypothetical protein
MNRIAGSKRQVEMLRNGARVNLATATTDITDFAFNMYLMARNNGGVSNVMGGSFSQAVQYWAQRDASEALARYNAVAGGTWQSANKTASVTNGPLTGPTVTPAATLPTGASYTLKLVSTSTPAGQTKTGTAATPIVFDGVTIANGDAISLLVTAASTDKTVAPSFASFSIAA